MRIQNTTGLALVVTVYLNDSQNPEPYITETIPAQGDPTALFNFGTSTGAFMTMNISRADGLPSPAPFDNIDLVAASQRLRRDPVLDLVTRALFQRQLLVMPGPGFVRCQRMSHSAAALMGDRLGREEGSCRRRYR